jgi:Rad3-related DNA helicase
VAARVADRYPAIPLWTQQRQMAESERDSFLARFVFDGRGVGFAVLGGVFAEGIDLPGSRLLGAFIATLGLPPVNAVNGEIERRMSAIFGTGYEYIYLIDDRFTRREVRRLLPPWWRIKRDDCARLFSGR